MAIAVDQIVPWGRSRKEYELICSGGWVSEVVRVDYELQRGGNEMLIPSRVEHEMKGLLSPTLSSKGGEGEDAETVLRLVSS
jgi:hypothetical protein